MSLLLTLVRSLLPSFRSTHSLHSDTTVTLRRDEMRWEEVAHEWDFSNFDGLCALDDVDLQAVPADCHCCTA